MRKYTTWPIHTQRSTHRITSSWNLIQNLWQINKIKITSVVIKVFEIFVTYNHFYIHRRNVGYSIHPKLHPQILLIPRQNSLPTFSGADTAWRVSWILSTIFSEVSFSRILRTIKFLKWTSVKIGTVLYFFQFWDIYSKRTSWWPCH